MERIPHQRVVDAGALAIRSCNSDVGKGDDFRGRDAVGRPIPIWVTELDGRPFPRILIDGVSIGDLLGMSTQNLLKRETKIEHQP